MDGWGDGLRGEVDLGVIGVTVETEAMVMKDLSKGECVQNE